MTFAILQCNANHCWAAHDLLNHYMSELGVGICTIAEPVRIPASVTWFGCDNGTAAVRWNPDVLPWPCIPVKRGLQFAVVRCGDVHVVSCYASPSLPVRGFLDFLESLSEVILDLGGKIILCGDYNAWSTLWGSSFTNTRGEEVERWAAAHDLRLVNVGTVPTCVRPQGSSVVDLTWATPSVIGSIDGWTVREDLETLSDHIYISFSVGVRSLRPSRSTCEVGRRWNLSKMDKEAFDLSLEWACSDETLEEEDLSACDFSTWMDVTMKEACDASAPIVGRRHPKKAAYWWSDSIAELRSSCVRARRLWQRGRRRGAGSSIDILEDLENSYRLKKRELRRAISKAKSAAWGELIRSVDSDP